MTVRESVNLYVLSSRDFLRLGGGDSLWSCLESAKRVDSLPRYTVEMFCILTDFLACECGVRLPGTKRVVGKLNLDGISAVVDCFTPNDLRTLRTKLSKVSTDPANTWYHWHEPPTEDTRGGFFGYGLVVEHHKQHEYRGIEYLWRQADHAMGEDDYLVIVAAEPNATDIM